MHAVTIESPHDLPFDIAIADDLREHLVSSCYIIRTIRYLVGIDKK